MAKAKTTQKCFIIMPISIPEDRVEDYKGDADHFLHVLEHLFVPALKNVGFDPIPPKSMGSEIIQAEIIKHLSLSELVLCDISILNPNVFFEFGIRTALNKPVALVVDDKTTRIPFDTSIINFHRYNSSLDIWTIGDEINALAEHVHTSYKKTKIHNALWKYFGVAQIGVFKPEESSIGDKIDLLMREVASLKSQSPETVPIQLVGQIDSVKNILSLRRITEQMLEQERERRRREKRKSDEDLLRSLERVGKKEENEKKPQQKDSADSE